MTTRPKVYVAGPYSKGDVVLNVRDAVLAASALLDLGLTPFCPHLTMLWHTVSPRPYQQWLDYDLEWLACCDALLRLPGESPGADVETARAGELGIPVRHTVADVAAMFGPAEGSCFVQLRKMKPGDLFTFPNSKLRMPFRLKEFLASGMARVEPALGGEASNCYQSVWVWRGGEPAVHPTIPAPPDVDGDDKD